jgi:hypothetical protein
LEASDLGAVGLRKDKELYIHLHVVPWHLFFIANRLNRSSFSISG